MQGSAAILNLCLNRQVRYKRKLILKGCALCVSRVSQLSKVMSLVALFITLLAAHTASFAQDEEDWWFDVELIAFKRNTTNTRLEEDFSSAAYTASSANAIDLLSFSLYQRVNPLIDLQGMLYECSVNTALFTSNLPLAGLLTGTEEAKEAAQYTPVPLLLNTDERFAKLIDDNDCSDTKLAIARSLLGAETVSNVPVYLQKRALRKTERPHLLDDQQLALGDFAKKLFAQRDIKALSHIAWRQPVVFGEENADYFRVFAGNKLVLPKPPAPTFDELKQKYDPELSSVIDQNSETFFAELKQQLDQAQPVNWTRQADSGIVNDTDASVLNGEWELDGKVKVYLNYVNRVPYLHIESEFQFHDIQLDSFGEAHIKQYPFKQRRRIISKQIHYFDHPKMGFVIRLQRYEMPTEVDNENIY